MALQTMIDNMPEKTGKNLKEWLQIFKEENFEKHSMAVNFLKNEHGVTHGFANTIVALSKEDPNSSEDLVANQYSGKENLKSSMKSCYSNSINLAEILPSHRKRRVSVLLEKSSLL